MKIVFLGSGNVATHLALALKAADQQILQIWSRTMSNAQILANQVAAKATSDLAELDRTAELYLIAVNDGSVAELASSLSGLEQVVAHTSGATSIDALANLNHFGVFYPLQTFSKQKALDLSDAPMCLEANSQATMEVLERAAKYISSATYKLSSDQRKILHLSAVFACNFSNHLYHMGYSIMEQHGLDFAILKPLIMETARKVQIEIPKEVQTGPAVRNDEETMIKHVELLNDRPDLQKIYKTLSESIKKTYL